MKNRVELNYTESDPSKKSRLLKEINFAAVIVKCGDFTE